MDANNLQTTDTTIETVKTSKPAKAPKNPTPKTPTPKSTKTPAKEQHVKKTINQTKDGRLTKMAVRVLEALAKAKKPVPFNKLTHLSEKWPKLIRWALGQASFAQADRDQMSLLGRKLVKATEVDVDGKSDYIYEITPAGVKTLEKIQAETKAKAKAK